MELFFWNSSERKRGRFMEALVKLGARLPVVLARAAAGDPIAIAELVAAGGAAVLLAIKERKK
jgi:hypothetical protein